MVSNTLDFLLGGCTAGASLILLNTKNEKMNKNFKLCSTSSIGNIYSNAPLGYVAHYHRTVTDHMLAVLHSTRDVCIRLHPLGVSCVSSCHAAFCDHDSCLRYILVCLTPTSQQPVSSITPKYLDFQHLSVGVSLHSSVFGTIL